jgi:hypothetical protein
MEFSEAVVELERFVGRAVWVRMFSMEGGERFPVLTAVGRLAKPGPIDPELARAARELGTPECATFHVDGPMVNLNVWANLLADAHWVEEQGGPRLRLELRDGSGIDLAEFAEDEVELLGLG